MRIVIVGAGIAGLVTAAALRGRGHSITICERARKLAPVGAGFTLQPNGIRRLAHLGLSDSIREVGSPVDRSFVCDWQGNEIPVDIMNKLSGSEASYSIHRADFQKILLGAIDDSVTIHTGREFESFTEDVGITVRFTDGSIEEADLLVGADGVRSAVQTALGNDVKPVSESIMAVRSLIPIGEISWAATEPRMGVWFGEGKTLLCYRVASGTLMNIAAYIPTDRDSAESWSAPSSTEELLSVFAGWEPRVIETVTKATDSFKWGIYDRPPLTRWCTRSAVLVGDAAHAMVPHLGQGANQAIEDAFALAEVLKDARPETLPSMLVAYESVRKSRAEAIQRLSRDAGQLYRNHANDDANQKAIAIIDFLRTNGLGEQDSAALAREHINRLQTTR
ncbi:NAD(P)/FAD-dependent oxidoreductase [Rhodococcus sp. KBW08]|uniref:FAD-dependent oxidoreductase n=1 Tax=Rhodococcus sp. KBW08 TaxID=2144188 RepID=UPI001626B6DC|nr:NAD(P)/FAD-dependent oxidoreductase [Rhodococcus sp. KBW08]